MCAAVMYSYLLRMFCGEVVWCARLEIMIRKTRITAELRNKGAIWNDEIQNTTTVNLQILFIIYVRA